jgi:hypothetical protein
MLEHVSTAPNSTDEKKEKEGDKRDSKQIDAGLSSTTNVAQKGGGGA